MQVRHQGKEWNYRGQERPDSERHYVAEATGHDKRQKEGWEGVLGVQMQGMEHEEELACTGKGTWCW